LANVMSKEARELPRNGLLGVLSSGISNGAAGMMWLSRMLSSQQFSTGVSR